MLDLIFSFIFDQLLDDWNIPYSKKIAGPVAFNLAFVTRWAHGDDQPTLASKGR